MRLFMNLSLLLALALLAGCGGKVTQDCGSTEVTSFAGDGYVDTVDGIGTAASFAYPFKITRDANHLYVLENGPTGTLNQKVIRKVTLATGEVTTLASGFYASDITTDGTNIYVTASYQTISKVVIATGEVTEMALTGTENLDQYFDFSAIVASADGQYLYVAVKDHWMKILQVEVATGQVTVLAGGGGRGSVDGIGTEAQFPSITAMATDGTSLYVGDYTHIRKIVIATGEVTTLAGGAENADDGTGTAAGFTMIKGIAADGTNLYVTDRDADRIRKVVIATGEVTTLAGDGTQGKDNGSGEDARFSKPNGIAAVSSADGSVSLYVVEWGNNLVRKIDYTPGGCQVSTADPSRYSLGGSVTGLSAKLMLQNNGGGDITITENGDFTFAKTVTSGEAYDITVKTQPNGQVCTVTNGSGTVKAAVSDIEVSCEASATPPSDPDAPANPTILDLTTVNQQPSLTGTYDSTDAEGGFKVKLNGHTFTLGTDEALSHSGNIWTLSIPTELAIGSYDITATAADAAGNVASASGVLTIVGPPPAPTITAMSSEDPTPTLSGTFDDANSTTFTVAVNGVTYTKGSDAALLINGNSWNLTIPDANALAVGTYDVVATTTDASSTTKTDTTTGELVVRGTTSNWSLQDHYTNDTTPNIRGTFPTDAGAFFVELGRAITAGNGKGSVWWFFAETRTDPEQGDILFDKERQQIVGTFDQATGEWQLTINSGLNADSWESTDTLSEGTYLLEVVESVAWSRHSGKLVASARLVVDLTAPNAPTVTSQTTTDTTPTITGTFDAADADVLTVAVNNVTYTLGTDTALTISGDTWSLTIPAGDALTYATYDVVATVKDKATNSATDSTMGELVIAPPVPTAPNGVSATAGDGQVTLSWTAVTGATSYNVYVGTSSGVTTASGTMIAGATSGNAISGLTNGTTYYFIVTAVNSAGESTASSEVSATPVDQQAPTVSASPGSSSFTNSVDVTLSCSDTGGSGCAATHYTLDSSTPTTGSATYSAPIAITSTTTVKFLAVDGVGNQSGVQSETYTLSLPVAPTGVSATAGNGQVTLTWSAVTGAAGYNIYYGTSSGVTTANGTKVASVSSGDAVTGLTNGTAYWFIVTAENASGEGAASGEVNATPQAPDTTAPQVSSGGLSPADGATSVARDSVITAAFNEDIFATTVNGTTFTLAGNNAVSGTVTFDGNTNTATFTPDSNMAMLTSHTATLTTGITDLAGNSLASNQSWSFTTADGAWGATPATVDTSAEDNNGGRVVVDEKGNATAVWLQYDGSANSVVANRYVPGAGWGSSPVALESGAGDAGGVDLAVDSDGNLFAVWQQADGGNVWHIWVARYDAATSSWAAPVQLETGANDAGAAQVAVDGGGNAIVVWNQTDGTRNNIWASRYAPVADTWSLAEKIENDDTTEATAPTIAMDSAGNAIVVWHLGDGFLTGDIKATHYANGSWNTTPVALETRTDIALGAQVAIDSSGNAIAVWVQSADGLVNNIMTNRYDAGTGTWSGATTIADGSGNGMAPQIALDSAGNALAVWVQDNGNDVWSNRFTASNTTWGTAEKIDTLADAAMAPQIAMDAAGHGIAVWFQNDTVSKSSTFAARFVKGTGWGTPTALENDDTQDNNLDRASLGMNSKGESMAVWHQMQSSGKYDVWANSFD